MDLSYTPHTLSDPDTTSNAAPPLNGTSLGSRTAEVAYPSPSEPHATHSTSYCIYSNTNEQPGLIPLPLPSQTASGSDSTNFANR